MKAEELRINNWMYDEVFKKDFQLNASHIFSFDAKMLSIKPIQLTEEWLLKFGFKKIIFNSEETGYGHEYSLDINKYTRIVFCDDFSFGVESKQLDTHWLQLDFDIFKGVHHLQNFHYALTNKELTITK